LPIIIVTLVYNTKGDYYEKVPLLLSKDKKLIGSYLAPNDLISGIELSLPYKLTNG